MNENTIKNLDFDMILVGGDIAYDNNVPTCYRAWDYFLRHTPHNKLDTATNSTRIIPMLLAVGNHDMGAYSYAGIHHVHDRHQPVMKHWFPQHTTFGEVPPISERRPYFSHQFGDKLLIMSLDVGYDALMEGEQLDWMIDVLENSNAKIKMAQFHGPIITSFKQTAAGDYVVQDVGQRIWVPVFDKYNMTLISENHSHVFMRSKLLKGMKEDSKGTLYIGEGSWGPKEIDPEVVNKEYFDKTIAAQSVWIVGVDDSNSIKLTAYDEKNTIIDELTKDY
eukprot:CAMPEP_0205827756 /NCGR_PEP_ID=MMETSP0206-20130828/32968_1 /ASSEMBLY_ACC=CAM_ASM_000279 /TAXON_ID=36767 /ORGANISM="Euplotes focardii, Strain TN1" /LENGTH=277 /DNA_ID=CAMNT_0053128933 /DNA_START=1068 /DNA_END=1901 /DNA_ORIENTATION=+